MVQETYDLFVKRLREERAGTQLTQKEMAVKLKMSESHYSKAETARRRLSFFETKWLCETPVDSFYIFTGKRVDRQYSEIFSKCEYEELLCHYEFVCMVALHPGLGRTGGLNAEDRRIIEYARYLLVMEQADKTIFKKHREYREYSQRQMAELLGVDSKKLRDLEKGKLLPDSELIWQMSSQLQIPFSLVLKDRNGLISEICSWLERLEPDKRELVLKMTQQYHYSV